MTVKELMEKLATFEPDTEVYIASDDESKSHKGLCSVGWEAGDPNAGEDAWSEPVSPGVLLWPE